MQQDHFRSIIQTEDSHLFITIELLQCFMFTFFIVAKLQLCLPDTVGLESRVCLCHESLHFWGPVTVSHFWYEKDDTSI